MTEECLVVLCTQMKDKQENFSSEPEKLKSCRDFLAIIRSKQEICYLNENFILLRHPWLKAKVMVYTTLIKTSFDDFSSKKKKKRGGKLFAFFFDPKYIYSSYGEEFSIKTLLKLIKLFLQQKLRWLLFRRPFHQP